MLARPARIYDFTAFARRQPTSPPPGDRIDAQLQNHADAIAATQIQVEKLLADQAKPIDVEGPARKILADAERAAQEIRRAAGDAAAIVDQAKFELNRIWSEAARARDVADRAEARIAAAVHASKSTPAPAPAPTFYPGQTMPKLGYGAGGFYAADDAGAAAVSADYAQVSIEWAEHMPDTIPGNILAINAISGEHWSSRWWAHRAGEFVGGFLGGLYMGPYPIPPVSTDTGQPIPIGSIYYNTSNNQFYVWNGTSWQPITQPQKAATASLFYLPSTNQTDFPLTVPDIYGNMVVGLDPNGDEGVEVCLNGVRLTPTHLPFVGDYGVDLPSSSVILNDPAPPGSVLCVDVLLAPHNLAPGMVLVQKLEAIHGDDVTTTFDLRDWQGNPVAANDSVQLQVVLEGVQQEPGVDYALGVDGTTVEFLAAPASDARIFIVFFANTTVVSP